MSPADDARTVSVSDASWFGGRAGTVDPTVTARFVRDVRVRDDHRA